MNPSSSSAQKNARRHHRSPGAIGFIWLLSGITLIPAASYLRDHAFFLIAAAVLGWSCGLMGSVLLVRRMALLGDALAHAVLPGVVIAAVLADSRNTATILSGAVIAGLLGVGLIRLLESTTKLKSDVALGFVLAVFYALGIAIKSAFQTVNLNSYIFGQIALISRHDFIAILILGWLVSGLIYLLHRPLMVASFDENYARSIGLPLGLLSGGLLIILALVVVVSLQAVGVVLVSALLITPAASAYLLSDRMGHVTLISGGLGIVAALSGCLISYQGEHLASGPLMVLSSSVLFFICFALAPRHGFLTRSLRYRGRRARIRRENTLKAIHRILEDREFEGQSVGLHELAVKRRQTLEECRQSIRELARFELADFCEGGESVLPTQKGFRRAMEIVRNHRLWELYLSQQANYPADHVHEDAEAIEHVLGEEAVRELERQLAFPQTDPHGKPIPGIQDIFDLQTTRSGGEMGRRKP